MTYIQLIQPLSKQSGVAESICIIIKSWSILPLQEHSLVKSWAFGHHDDYTSEDRRLC